MDKATPIPMHDGINLNTTIHKNDGSLWLVVTHGVGEYHQRHRWPVALFGQDCNILQYDLRGHGQSEGPLGYGTFKLFNRDLDDLLAHLKRHHGMEKYILFGHSMGALICAHWLQNRNQSEDYPAGVFLNAPPVGFPGILGKIIRHTPTNTLSKLRNIPFSVKIGGLIDTGNLSHLPEVEEEYRQDPLNHRKLHSQLLLEMVVTSRQTFSRPLDSRCPLFVTVGSKDKIICVPSLVHYFTSIEKSAHLNIIEGAWHEIHNEARTYQIPYFDFLQTNMRKLRS